MFYYISCLCTAELHGYNNMVIAYKTSPAVSNSQLEELFVSAWSEPGSNDYTNTLNQNTVWICAYDKVKLVGFVKVLWDGGKHGFVLDTTTHVDYQHQGIATELLRRIAIESKKLGIQWLHVDFDSSLRDFYRKSGFQHTEAGLLNLEA